MSALLRLLTRERVRATLIRELAPGNLEQHHVSKVYTSMATILGQHAVVSAMEWPARKWRFTPIQIVKRLRELGITPEKPDAEIMSMLIKLVKSGEMVESEDHHPWHPDEISE